MIHKSKINMRHLKLLILGLSVVLTFMACQKDEGKHGIAGTWEGNWGFDNDTPTFFEKWVIESDGDLAAYDDDDDKIATGSWTLDGLEFKMEYTSTAGNDYRFTGLYHDQLKEIIGTWGHAPSTANGGTFEMYKD